MRLMNSSSNRDSVYVGLVLLFFSGLAVEFFRLKTYCKIERFLAMSPQNLPFKTKNLNPQGRFQQFHLCSIRKTLTLVLSRQQRPQNPRAPEKPEREHGRRRGGIRVAHLQVRTPSLSARGTPPLRIFLVVVTGDNLQQQFVRKPPKYEYRKSWSPSLRTHPCRVERTEKIPGRTKYLLEALVLCSSSS